MTKNQKIILVIGLALVVVIVGWRASQNRDKRSDTVKIGAVFGLTGDAASWGEAARNATLMAVEEINANGGINGRPIELIIEDMQSSSKGSISAVSKLINVDKAAAIVGPTWLDSYQGAAELVKNNNVVLISPDAGIEAVNGDTVHRNVFSTWYRTDVKAKMISEYMAKNGVKKLAQLYENDSYYTDFANRVKKYSEQSGIQVVATELLNADVTDVRTPTLKLKASGADAIIFGLYDDNALYNFLKVRKTSFPTMPLFSDELVHDHYTKPEYKGLYENTVYFHATQPNNIFEQNYLTKYKIESAFGAAPAYDAMMIIAKMLKDKGLNADYNGYLRSTTFKSAAYGDMMFDELGGVKTENNQFNLWKVIDSKAIKLN